MMMLYCYTNVRFYPERIFQRLLSKILSNGFKPNTYTEYIKSFSFKGHTSKICLAAGLAVPL